MDFYGQPSWKQRFNTALMTAPLATSMSGIPEINSLHTRIAGRPKGAGNPQPSSTLDSTSTVRIV